MNWDQLDISISGLRGHYQAGDFSPQELVDYLLNLYRLEAQAASPNPIWIKSLTESELQPYLAALAERDPAQLPLYGVPFAIKDNIDLAGISTTAACPAYAYTPQSSATVVEQLIAAGAIPMGKTNLDQFATGLVGVRSPYGECRNAFNPELISGGSSAGSAVAVAKHWVSFALGTDTAGSGRVPASLNNLVGLKPSCGLLSTRGVVPACRSLDCVSIFALNCDDANSVFDQAAVFDAADGYARRNTFHNGPRYYRAWKDKLTLGVPAPEQLAFFGDSESQALYQQALHRFAAEADIDLVEIDFAPFVEAAKLLYEGPWVSERYLAAQTLVDERPDTLLPVIRQIIAPGSKPSAAAAFSAQYRLKALRQQAYQQLQRVDCCLTPTNGTDYSIEELLADPIRLNSNMGYYTNFMNLFDLAALAVPVGFKARGNGFGVTLFAAALQDKKLLSVAATLQNLLRLPAGLKQPFVEQGQSATRPAKAWVELAVCGAHLQGLPLNGQLRERGATLLQKTHTAARYRLFALAGGPPLRPGLQRVRNGGVAIEVETWRVPVENLGSFVAEIPPPLGIGQVELADGRWVSSFICEPWGLTDAEDISQYGGWRAYLAAR